MVKLFFSYSHRDETLRDELGIHLAGLKRQGLIETWHDRRIGAGQEFVREISQQLEEADVVLLLVSPYLIASDYCYDIEMRRAMERHEAGSARVIPVILQPCEWTPLPFGKLMATPTDGKPITKFPNHHDAFLDVTRAIRKAAAELGSSSEHPSDPRLPAVTQTAPLAGAQVRSSNLRLKKAFTDHDRDQHLSQGFEYIANYFENSLSELKARNAEVSTDFRRIDGNRFTAALYRNGKETGRCTITLGSRRGGGGITFSWGDADRGNGMSWNESMSVEDDGTTMFLKPLGMMAMGQKANGKSELTYEGAAEYFRSAFVKPLQ